MRTLRILILSSLAIGLTACGAADPQDNNLEYAGFNLEADDGGFDKTASIEVFEADDPSAFDMEATEADDPLVSDELTQMGPEDGLQRYEIRLIWGQKELTPNTPPTDWSGAVSTNLGALRIIRAIRFEKATDRFLKRTSPQSVELESVTTVHNDGIQLRLIVPKTAPTDMQPSLTIALGDVNITIPHAKLKHLVKAQKVDELGNGMAIVAFAHTACPKGLLKGHWARKNAKGGTFGGAVANAQGQKIGKLAGIWGTRKDGKRRFYGLFIKDGKPEGVIRGTWKSLPNKAGGIFRGHWVTGQKEHKGILRGFYKVASEGGQGQFMGVWAERGCDDGATKTLPPKSVPGDADLCSADGICVADPTVACDGDDCQDNTDLE